MIIPSHVKIGYKDYSVEQVDYLDDEVKLLYGRVNYDAEVIKLCNRYPENQRKCVLVHEIIHAIDDMLEIDFKEEQVIKLAKGLYQVIKDNPLMFTEETAMKE